jgi:hypothetical protein
MIHSADVAYKNPVIKLKDTRLLNTQNAYFTACNDRLTPHLHTPFPPHDHRNKKRPNEHSIATMYERMGLYDLDPELHEEEWPLLELTNVAVYHSDELVDLFDVAEKGPFRVKGKLHKVARKWKGIGTDSHE